MKTQFRNIHTVSGEFLFNDERYNFSGIFETDNEALIKHLTSEIQSNNWEIVGEETPLDLNDIDLKIQDKDSLIELAKSLEIEIVGLSKKQLIEAIEAKKLEGKE